MRLVVRCECDHSSLAYLSFLEAPSSTPFLCIWSSSFRFYTTLPRTCVCSLTCVDPNHGFWFGLIGNSLMYYVYQCYHSSLLNDFLYKLGFSKWKCFLFIFQFDAEFRRFSIDRRQTPVFETLYSTLEKLHHLPGTQFVVQYTDPRDNELLPINNDDNFTHALNVCRSILRILLQRKGNWDMTFKYMCIPFMFLVLLKLFFLKLTFLYFSCTAHRVPSLKNVWICHS